MVRAIGKVLSCGSTQYKVGDWSLLFGPSVGVPGCFYVSLLNPRGWQSLEWFRTRAEIFAWVETQMNKYETLFVQR